MKIKDILALVQKETGLDLSIPRRNRERVYARALFFKLARRHTYHSLSQIGALIGKDHASVLHGIRIFDNVIVEYEKDLYDTYKKMEVICSKKRALKGKDLNPELYYRTKYAEILVAHRALLNQHRELKNKVF
jgi:hypothetical protein|tara:strand:+ start:1394 stop:1792 length:399 start_codon:yes stop_codon:yes gene_type:complete